MLGRWTIDTGNARAAANRCSLTGGRCPAPDAKVVTASPRIWEVGAPGDRIVIDDRFFGATENSPRQSGIAPALKRSDAVVVASSRRADASSAGSWGPRGTSRSFRTCRAGRVGLGRGLMKGLSRRGCIEFKRQGIGEGIPCLGLAIGADRMSDDDVKTPGSRRKDISRSLLGPIIV